MYKTYKCHVRLSHVSTFKYNIAHRCMYPSLLTKTYQYELNIAIQTKGLYWHKGPKINEPCETRCRPHDIEEHEEECGPL